MSDCLAVVLAAGQGTRMKSDLPKVLVPVRARPMIEFVLDALSDAGVRKLVIVVGYQAQLVKDTLGHRPSIEYAHQAERRGTGHAVMMCREQLAAHDGPVLVVAGDSPMLQAASVRALLEAFDRDRPACLLGTAMKDDPTGLGRIVRDDQGRFLRIVEEKDATPDERAIREVNLSTYVFDSRDLLFALERIQPNNKQAEYYLTDCPSVLLEAGRKVDALAVLRPIETLSVNTLEELAAVEAAMRAGER